MKKLRKTRGLVTDSLEMMPREAFSQYSQQITELIGRSSGVYALYDDNELYYVGRATTLRGRVRQHLRDRHAASWTHFSFYLIRDSSHIGEFESLLVRISNPKGNSVKPKGRDSRKMLKRFQQMVKQQQQEQYNKLFSITKVAARKPGANINKSLVGLVSKRTPIFKTYKGKEYKAFLTKTGLITCNGKSFDSPTGAAKAIAKITKVNGWRFWYIRNKSGEWVKLSDYK